MNKREENRKRGEEIRRKRLKEQQERLKRFAVAKSSAALPTSAKPNSVSSRNSSLPVESADDRKPLSLQNKGVDPRAHGSHVLHGGVNRQNQSPSSNRALRHNDNQESREKNVERKFDESGWGSIGGKGEGGSSPALAWGGNFRSQWKAWGRSVSPKEERKNLVDSTKRAPDDSTSIKLMPQKLDEKNLGTANKNSDQAFTREAKVYSTNERETQGFRKRENFQKPEGLNDTRAGKRSRRSETDNIPGRGIGRGRGTTLPAWMTRRNAGENSNESLQTNYPRPNADVVASLNEMRPAKRSRTFETGNTAGRAMGRGRGTTLPAWMTRRNAGEMTEESLQTNCPRPNFGDVVDR
mmetsp:Transcript_17408/g.26435  ORF Transcript_17408/g.26435 Transcript_17408/m.26435 type:complete len:353 (-) Transcript_17408:46-1104(-)